MPLLKMDQFGNISEYGFGAESRTAEITPDEGNVIFGEMTPAQIKRRNLAHAKQKKRHQTKLKSIAIEKQRLAIKNKVEAAAERSMKKDMARTVAYNRHRRSNAYLKGLALSKDPNGGHFNSKELVDANSGFSERGKHVARKSINSDAGDYGQIKLLTRPRGRSGWPPRSGYQANQPGDFGYEDSGLGATRTLGERIAALERSIKKYNAMPSGRLKDSLTKNNREAIKYLAMLQKEAATSGFGYEDNDDTMSGWKIKIKAPKIRIKVPTIKQVVKTAGKVGGKMLNAPLDLTHKALTTVPGVKDVYKGLDKVTGGTLNSLHRTLTLPGRALQTGKVSKAELMEALVNVVKVGAIVVTGGGAAAVIGATAGAMKNGPLGKTKFGNTILSVGEFAGGGGFAGGLKKAAEKQAVNMAAKTASKEVGKHLGPLGAIAASVAVQAGAAGAQSPGSKIPNAATTTGAANAANVAQAASKKASEEVAKSGMKFSSDAAMAEAKKLASAQAKAIVAGEFKKRTGVPLDLAVQVSSGKMPSAADIQKRVVAEMRAAPETLKNELAQIPGHAKNADPMMRKILAQREAQLSEEITRRQLAMAQVEKGTANELVSHNLAFKPKAEKFVDEMTSLENLAKQAKEMRAKAEGKSANLEDKNKYALEATRLENEVLRRNAALEPLANEVNAMFLKSEMIKEDGATRVAMAEYGGATKYNKGMPGSESSGAFAHPLAAYSYEG